MRSKSGREMCARIGRSTEMIYPGAEWEPPNSVCSRRPPLERVWSFKPEPAADRS